MKALCYEDMPQLWESLVDIMFIGPKKNFGLMSRLQVKAGCWKSLLVQKSFHPRVD